MKLSAATDANSGNLKTVWSARHRLLLSAASAILFLLIFAWLADGVFRGNAEQFDLRGRAFVHQFASPPLTAAMKAITFLGSPAFIWVSLLVLVVLFYRASLPRYAAWLVTAMAGEVILEVTLKLAFHRTRPAAFFGAQPSGYSFPSGHALGSFCFYGVLAGLLCSRIKQRSLRVLVLLAATALILAIGFSRIYLGVHYPTDVIAGYCAAGVWVSALLLASRVHHSRKPSPRASD